MDGEKTENITDVDPELMRAEPESPTRVKCCGHRENYELWERPNSIKHDLTHFLPRLRAQCGES